MQYNDHPLHCGFALKLALRYNGQVYNDRDRKRAFPAPAPEWRNR